MPQHQSCQSKIWIANKKKLQNLPPLPTNIWDWIDQKSSESAASQQLKQTVAGVATRVELEQVFKRGSSAHPTDPTPSEPEIWNTHSIWWQIHCNIYFELICVLQAPETFLFLKDL